ncbi:MAG: hypothetical protein M0R75_03740 [Dehalococcoidia bacterium]|nr:hypothetical protein [Dehalococcoidia bacterium]
MSNTPYRDLAPEITRQRLLVEGYWTVEVDEPSIRQLLLDLAAHLGLHTYGEPVVYAPASGMGREANAGWDAFVPLIDSGISAYFWSGPRFFSLVLYTCKPFDADAAVAFVRDALGATEDMARLEF